MSSATSARYHAIVFPRRQEAAAFVAALSRVLSSPHGQQVAHGAIEVWLESVTGEVVTLCLSPAALVAAQAAFAPVPVASERSDAPRTPGCRLVIGDGAGGAWGILEATRRLFGDGAAYPAAAAAGIFRALRLVGATEVVQVLCGWRA